MIFHEYKSHEPMSETDGLVKIVDYSDITESYRSWMMEKMRAATHYAILFDILHDTQFEWFVEWDAHRASDGRNLRVRYEEEMGYEYPDFLYEQPCSFLEMVIAMAFTIEDRIMYDPDEGDRTYLWFWEMMHNIGLDICTDEWLARNGKDGLDYVNHQTEIVIKRRYDDNGYGSLFPCKDDSVDMRKEELWVQANAYFLDRSVA